MGVELTQASPGPRRLSGRVLVILILSFAALAVLWRTPAAWPVKIPLVAAHELGHGLTAWLCGGSIAYIEINAADSGMTFGQDVAPLWMFNGGYLFSLLLGALLFMLSGRAWLGRAAVLLLGAVVGLVVLRFVPWAVSFGFVGGLIEATALAVLAVFAPTRVNGFVGRLLGLGLCGYAVLDIVSDLLLGSQMRSDARMLGDLTSIPFPVWCVGWLILAGGTMAAVLWMSWRKKG